MYLGSLYDYCVNTLDPVIENTLLSNDNYFYYMPLMLKYNQQNAPTYLKEESFNLLKSEPHRLDAIKIHTRTIVEVLSSEVPDCDLTKVILMDHLDWFSNEDAAAEIDMVYRKMAKGGRVFWRAAGRYPWYNSLFEERGFKVVPCQIRENSTMYIDRVNSMCFNFYYLYNGSLDF
jgi:betaine lipid synthase